MIEIKALEDNRGRWHVTLKGRDIWRCDFARKDLAEMVINDLMCTDRRDLFALIERALGPDWQIRIDPSSGPHIKCVEAEIVFPTQRAASEWSDIPPAWFSVWLTERSSYSTLLGLHWIRTYEQPTPEDEIIPIYIIEEYNPDDLFKKRREVICETTGERFETITAAAQRAGTYETKLSRALKGSGICCGMKWRYAD